LSLIFSLFNNLLISILSLSDWDCFKSNDWVLNLTVSLFLVCYDLYESLFFILKLLNYISLFYIWSFLLLDNELINNLCLDVDCELFDSCDCDLVLILYEMDWF